MTNAADIKHWQTMSFRDADAMIAWLSAIGFVEHATYRDEADPSVVEHAEWLWPGGGGIMFGSQRPDGAVTNVGGSAAYLVVDDPDAVFDRAVAAGGDGAPGDGRPGLRRPRRQRRGSRGQPLVLRELPASVMSAAWQSGQCEERPSSTTTCVTTCSSAWPRWSPTSWSPTGSNVDDFISIIFTATSDLNSEFPAYAARRLGFGDVPLICARELEIEGSMPRVVRMMAHIETDLPRADITHVYLHGAAALRRDLTRVHAVPDDE